MPELIDSLRAALDAAEAQARAATAGDWHWVDPGGKPKQALVAGPFVAGGWRVVMDVATGDVYPSVSDAEHIAAWDPSTVLRLIERDRRLIDLHKLELSTPPGEHKACGYCTHWWPCPDVKDAAAFWLLKGRRERSQS